MEIGGIRMKRMVTYLLLSLGWATPLPGDLVLPPDGPIEEVVDLCIDARLRQSDTVAARPADDATLIRRTTLDLLGRVPAAWEVRTMEILPDSGTSDFQTYRGGSRLRPGCRTVTP